METTIYHENIQDDLWDYIENGLDPARYERTAEAFKAIGFPDDAADFLGEWYPETCVYAYHRMVYGTYDWATVGVFDVEDVQEMVNDVYGPGTDIWSVDAGFIIQDAAFDGVIVLSEF